MARRFVLALTISATRNEDDLTSFESTLPSRADSSRQCVLYVSSHRYSEIPLRISAVCRNIHRSLTGPKARRRAEVDERSIDSAWTSLDRLWRDLDELRSNGIGGVLEMEDLERYIHGWQVRVNTTCAFSTG